MWLKTSVPFFFFLFNSHFERNLGQKLNIQFFFAGIGTDSLLKDNSKIPCVSGIET